MSLGIPRGMHVYLAQDDATGLVKIGASNQPDRRVANLSRAAGRPLRLMGVIHNARHRGERSLHKEFDYLRMAGAPLPTGEWFRPGPRLMEFAEHELVEYHAPGKVAFGPDTDPNAEKPGQLYKPEQIAEMMGVPKDTVRAWVADGCPHLRLRGRLLRLNRADVVDWLDQGRAA